MADNNIKKELKSFIPVVKGLGKTLGKHFEIVLHDMTREASIVAIENSHISDRKVGDKAPELLKNMLNSIKEDEDMVLNYVIKTEEGRPLKSSTILIRDDDNQIIGAFCINIDLTNIKIAQKFLNELSDIEEEKSLRDKFPEDVEDFLEIVIQNSLEEVDKPVHLLTKEDKLKIVEYLDENNAFSIKDTINTLAQELNVSRYTIYNYLDEVRAKKD
ncbi:MAG: helix-turn-helix transcriptional regulator [Halanaerobiales bacterium]